MKWPKLDEVDGETEQLYWIVEHGWDWEWPGWKWVANRLNDEYKNNRSAGACRMKFNSLEKVRAH
jgi:hypothetical protein